ncbi:hypothetical protein [Oceanobacillus sp. FSL K6-0127]|uniref:hypothetical protein n=1 Tax=Oceanobacillus sp. FSL K6-0127 TaxID=2921420 RepID=UPI0030EF47A7
MIILLLITVGCGHDVSEPKITQAKAEAIVLQHLTEDRNKVEIKIKSVSNSRGKYIVEWEIDKNCEFGAVQVDDQSGELLEAEETNC